MRMPDTKPSQFYCEGKAGLRDERREQERKTRRSTKILTPKTTISSPPAITPLPEGTRLVL
jgi:hypothetical protein